MSRYKGYEPLFKGSFIDFTKCKYLQNEVCVNSDCIYCADYPYSFCKCESKEDCKYFEKEDGK